MSYGRGCWVFRETPARWPGAACLFIHLKDQAFLYSDQKSFQSSKSCCTGILR